MTVNFASIENDSTLRGLSGYLLWIDKTIDNQKRNEVEAKEAEKRDLSRARMPNALPTSTFGQQRCASTLIRLFVESDPVLILEPSTG